MKTRKSFFNILFGLIFLSGCGSPGYDSLGRANSLQISAVLDGAVESLNKGDCTGAFSLLLPFYNSSNSTNDIRMMTASTYGCQAKLKVLNVALDLSKLNVSIAGFWGFAVQEFPSVSSPDDGVPTAAEAGIDAAISAMNLGVSVTGSNFINTGGNNPGALRVTDRIGSANTYLPFLSMALIGSLLNRNGAPNASYQRTQAIPWLTASSTSGDGCALASATLYFYDGVSYLASASTGSLSQVYSGLGTLFSTALDAACAFGCATCGGSVSCSSCPQTLRDRTSCTGSSTDVNSCAAAGINRFINITWAGTP